MQVGKGSQMAIRALNEFAEIAYPKRETTMKRGHVNGRQACVPSVRGNKLRQNTKTETWARKLTKRGFLSKPHQQYAHKELVKKMCTHHLECAQANIEKQDTRSFYFRIRYYTYFYIMWFLPEQVLFRYQHMSNRRVVTFIFMAGVPKAQCTTHYNQ